MPRIPSRRHYWASAGFSLLIAAGFLTLRRSVRSPWPVFIASTAFLMHNVGYLWTVKHDQILRRAVPIEQLIQKAREHKTSRLRVACFPGDPEEARRALALRVGETKSDFLTREQNNGTADISFCDVSRR